MHSSTFGNYTLSNITVNKLNEVMKRRGSNNSKQLEFWKIITRKVDENNFLDNKTENDVNNSYYNLQNNSIIATQFYFSPKSITSGNISENSSMEVQDIEKLLFETLEHTSGNLDLNLLAKLSNSEIAETLENLRMQLSITGLLNVLKGMCDFDIEQRMLYFDIFCSKLILPKLCEIDIGERTVTNSMEKLTKKFPDEIRKMIYIPILNCDLKENTTVISIMDTFSTDKNNILLLDFTSHVNQIKEWHFSILEKLLTTPVEESAKSQLIKMFLDSCTQFSKNKFFGKLIVAFITAGSSFSEDEVNMLNEIADVHKTPLKRALLNAIKKL